MRKFSVNLILVLFAFFLFGFDDSPSTSSKKAKVKKVGVVYFEGSLKEALIVAKNEGKLVFIDCHTSWCKPCKLMNNMLENDVKLGEFLNENFVCLSKNMEKGEGLKIKRKYQIGTYPSLLFIKSNGVLKNKFVGLPEYGATEILNFAKLASRKY